LLKELDGTDLGEVEFRNGGVLARMDSRGYWWADREYHGHGTFPDWEGPFDTYQAMIDNAEEIFGMCLEEPDG